MKTKKIKKYFLFRLFLYGGIGLLLLFLLIFNLSRPIGEGNWNQQQIRRISSQDTGVTSFTFAVFGDNREGLSIFKRILKGIDQQDYLFAIDLGDLVSYGTKQEYLVFYNLIKERKTPLLTVIGNHDVAGSGRQHYAEIFGKFYYSFSYNDCLFIVLDNAESTSLDQLQQQWLEDQLQRDFPCQFVFLHIPPFDPRPERWHAMEDQEKAQRFMAMMERYQPTVVFTGHIHGYYNLVENGVNYLITGGAGSPLITDDSAAAFHHYIKISVEGAKIKKEVIPVPSFSLIDSLLSWGREYKFYLAFGLFLVILIADTSFFFIKKLRKIKKEPE